MSICHKTPNAQDYINNVAISLGINPEYAQHMLLAFGMQFVKDYVKANYDPTCPNPCPRKVYAESAFAIWQAYPLLREMSL